MVKLRAALFETLRLSAPGGQSLELGSPTTRSLLAYLLLNRSRPSDRRRLAFLFWPRTTESAARRNLRQYLHHIRTALAPVDPEGSLLLATGTTAQINPQAEVWLDVEAFLHGVRAEASPAEVETALNLYTGDLLEDIYDDWCMPERDRLRQSYLAALDNFTQAMLSAGRLDAAMTYAVTWATTEPLDENALRRLMTVYALNGDRSKAIQQYQAFAQLMEEELGTDPLPETTTLLHAIQNGTLITEAETQPTPIVDPRKARTVVQATPLAPTLPLVGRLSELAQLSAAVKNARQGKGQLVLITGEAGIGKTRLLQEYLSQHAQQNALLSTCYELESMVPFAPLRQALENNPALHALLSAGRAQPHPLWMGHLSTIVPGIRQYFPYFPSQDAPPDANALREALVQLLITLSRQTPNPPLNLIIDDLHWADSPTWELLSALARRTTSEPLLILGLCRVEDLPTERQPMMRAIERSSLLMTLPLQRLTVDETADLAHYLSPEEAGNPIFLQRLFHETEGNPFFIIESVRAMHELGPGAQLRSPQPPSMPHSIQRVIEARLDRLSPASREALASAAAVGRTFTFSLIQEISQATSEDIIAFIEEWLQRGLVQESKDGYDFRHDKFRQVAYSGLSRARREYAHRRIADVLENAIPPADAATLAHHYTRSDQPLKALPYLARAGEQALRLRSYHEAREVGMRAVSLLRQMPGPRQRSERLELNLQLAQAYAFSGDLQRAIEIMNESEQLAHAMDDEAHLGQIFYRSSQFYWLRGQPETASDYARRTLRAAEELEEQTLLQAALRMLGRVSIALAAFDDAIAYLLRYVNLQDEELAGPSTKQLPAVDMPIVLGYLGVAYSRVGAWERALASARQGLELARAAASNGDLNDTNIFARMQLAMVLAGYQEWQDCLETIAPIPDPQDEEDITPPLFMALSLRGYCLSHLGEARSGVKLIRKALKWAQATGHRVFHYLPRMFLAESLLLAGELAEAQQEAQRGLAESRQAGNRWACGVTLKLLADISSRLPSPDWPQVEAYLIESMHLLRQIRARPDLARTYLSLRRLYDRAGQIAWAVDCHFRATTIYDELGMHEELRQAQGQAAGERRGAVVIPDMPLRGPNIPLEEEK